MKLMHFLRANIIMSKFEPNIIGAVLCTLCLSALPSFAQVSKSATSTSKSATSTSKSATSTSKSATSTSKVSAPTSAPVKDKKPVVNRSVAFSSKAAPLAKARPLPQKPVAVNRTAISSPTVPVWLDVPHASLLAKQQRKFILADFYTDWCHWCKVMDKRTFQDPEVAAYLARNFVCMRVDAQDGKDGEELAQRHQITGFPTIMVFRYNGQPLALYEGFKTPTEFMRLLKQLPVANVAKPAAKPVATRSATSARPAATRSATSARPAATRSTTSAKTAAQAASKKPGK